jgi:hypothetical protein
MSTIFEHGYALIVGVDANQIPRLALPAVAKDVQAVHDVLVHPERCAYNPDNVKLLMGEQATRDNILEALYWLQGKVREDAQATAVIYYSGHGMVDKATDQYYLIPYNISELSRIRQFALKAEDLTAEISTVNAKRMLAILDCCHAAGMDVKDIDLAAIDSAPAVEAAPFPLDLPQTKNIPSFDAEPGAKNVSDLLDGEGRAVLNSSTGSQSSYVRTDGAMSLFTYHLIEALTGHAPHPDDATIVYVTDVMSWVTHQVKKSAREQGRDQTPVMKTSGVFPIAQLIGGQGVAKGMGQLPPNPLEPLPPASGGMQAEGSIVTGTVTAGGDFAGRDMVKKEGGIHFGDGNTATFQGPVAGGDQTIHHGDAVHGDKVGGDKVGGDKISVGDISGSQGIAIGREARADVRIQQGPAMDELTPLFAPLLQQVAQQDATAVAQVKALQAEAARGEEADDEKMADLIESIAAAAPTAVAELVNLFTNSLVAKAAGAATKYMLKRIRK